LGWRYSYLHLIKTGAKYLSYTWSSTTTGLPPHRRKVRRQSLRKLRNLPPQFLSGEERVENLHWSLRSSYPHLYLSEERSALASQSEVRDGRGSTPRCNDPAMTRNVRRVTLPHHRARRLRREQTTQKRNCGVDCVQKDSTNFVSATIRDRELHRGLRMP